MRYTKQIAAALMPFLIAFTACGTQPPAEPAPPEEDIVIAITDPPTTEPATDAPTTEAVTESETDTEETESELEPANGAEAGQAYLAIVDSAWYIKYFGCNEQTELDDMGWFLSYDAGIADITRNGTYKVSVNADTKGFRLASTENIDGENIPQGLSYLAVVLRDGMETAPDAVITIDKVKVDGKEIELNGKSCTTSGEDRGTGDPSLMSVIYDQHSEELPSNARCEDGDVSDQDDEDDYSMKLVDTEDFEEWQKVEVTFTISGLEEADTTDEEEDSTEDEENEETTEE